MINTFIAAITALFFWNKSTKDVEEKTQLSSWTRTIVYGVLMSFVLVCFLKSYEVATINTNIDITGYKSCVDSANNNIDTIDVIRIMNCFSSGITENGSWRKLKTSKEDIYQKASTVYIEHSLHNDDSCSYKIGPIVEDFYKKNKYKKFSYNDIPIDYYNHLYEIHIDQNAITSIFPILPSYKENVPCDPVEGFVYDVIRSDFKSLKTPSLKAEYYITDSDGNIQVKKANHEAFAKYYSFICNIGDTIDFKDTKTVSYENKDYVFSTLDFLTTADVSQYTHVLNIKSDCYIKRVEFVYDLPIEISPYDSCMHTYSRSFVLDGKLLKNSAPIGSWNVFHVKLPTLANFQLIRSLILTTLLTALVTLFFMNLFYRIRKHFLSFKEKHIEEINENKVKSFRIKLLIILFLFLFLIFYLTLRLYFDKPFHIELEKFIFLYEYYVWIGVGIIFLLAILIYCLFRKAYSVKIKSKK